MEETTSNSGGGNHNPKEGWKTFQLTHERKDIELMTQGRTAYDVQESVHGETLIWRLQTDVGFNDPKIVFLYYGFQELTTDSVVKEPE